MTKPAIGLIGLGLMGKPMGLNLLNADYSLTVFNRTKSRADSLVAAGAKLASSPREVAACSDVLITIVSDPPALESVLWGTGSSKSDNSSGQNDQAEHDSGEHNSGENFGAFAGLKKGSIYIDCSTVSPALARKIASAAAAKGVQFLDAPVTGGTWGAEKGELVFMVGGSAATLNAVEPILSAMGKKWFLLGDNGAGQTVKLAMNSLLAVEVEAFAEALTLVMRAGIAGEKLVEVMQSSMARAAVLDVKAPLLLKDDYTASFPLRLMHKDLTLALDLANELNVDLPTTTAAHRTYGKVKEASRDDVDYAAVMKFWHPDKAHKRAD